MDLAVALIAAAAIGGTWIAAPASEPGQLAAARVRQDRYQHFLDDMLFTHAGDNRGFGPEHNLARDNIVTLFESFGLTVSLEPVVYYGETYHNVVGTRPGSLNPQRQFVIGAHYDSLNNGGADANGSGVAALLEAARVLAPFPADDTIRFVAFDRSEQGLLGSIAYLEAHLTDDVQAMISVDMVAYNTTSEAVRIFGRAASNPLKNSLGDAVTEYGDGLTFTLEGILDASDHAPFEWFGRPACLLREAEDNPYHHLFEDNVDTPNYIDYAFATRVTRAVVGWLVDHVGVTVSAADGDSDDDGNVDMSDFAAFQRCFRGTDVTYPPGLTCHRFDFDFDDDVDLPDWGVLRLLLDE